MYKENHIYFYNFFDLSEYFLKKIITFKLTVFCIQQVLHLASK